MAPSKRKTPDTLAGRSQNLTEFSGFRCPRSPAPFRPDTSWRGRPILFCGSAIISFHCEIQPTVRAKRKDGCEHRRGEAHGFEDDAGVEIHVREQLLFREIRISQCCGFRALWPPAGSGCCPHPAVPAPHPLTFSSLWRVDRGFCKHGVRSPSGGKGRFCLWRGR